MSLDQEWGGEEKVCCKPQEEFVGEEEVVRHHEDMVDLREQMSPVPET